MILSDNTSQSIVTKKEVKNKQIMRVKLTEKQNGTYFTCNVIEATKHVYTVRLYFYMIAPSSNHSKYEDLNFISNACRAVSDAQHIWRWR